ncbi:MAG: hypothetical protein IT480_02575 [Gammaproteobacteria bacterium]|nr:hypothetical protein [Gammaproteobacteria bacterium]
MPFRVATGPAASKRKDHGLPLPAFRTRVISQSCTRRFCTYSGGPQDIAESNALDDFKHINRVPVFVASQPGAGHIGLFMEPRGEATRIELDWLEWQFDKDRTAARTFVGTDRTLCRDFRWEVHRKGIK